MLLHGGVLLEGREAGSHSPLSHRASTPCSTKLACTCPPPAPPTAVTRIRPEQPAGLRIIHYAFAGTPAWIPAIPLYSGLPRTALPPELSTVGNAVDVEGLPVINYDK